MRCRGGTVQVNYDGCCLSAHCCALLLLLHYMTESMLLDGSGRVCRQLLWVDEMGGGEAVGRAGAVASRTRGLCLSAVSADSALGLHVPLYERRAVLGSEPIAK
jgi:hypothetical protein